MANTGPQEQSLRVTLQQQNICGNPGCATPQPKHKCARCMSICYCSRECQLQHYPAHKGPCKAIAAQFHSVPVATFIGFDPADVEDRAVVLQITATAKSMDAIASSKTPVTTPKPDMPLEEYNESVLPLLPAHKDEDSLINSEGQYIGVELPPKVLESMIMRAELRECDTVFALSMTCGTARVVVSKASGSLSLYTPNIPVFSPDSTKQVSLTALVRWRRASLSKAEASVAEMSPTDKASICQELLHLLDKTVYPTLQLVRALHMRGALMIQADETSLAWQFKPRSMLASMGDEVLRAVDNYDTQQAVVTLTQGSAVATDGSSATTVLLVNPLHVAKAFFEQAVDQNVLTAVSAKQYQTPCHLELASLLQRQQQKYGASKMLDEESEA
eukprot:m.134757 g.134757  ORF g.134757 m.134757 type:complete len:388 (-) comp15978_c0_seq4:324-1487(-)